MVNVTHKRCAHPDCKKIPSFSYEGQVNGLYCAEHRLENMVRVKSKKCAYPKCRKEPSFNYEEQVSGLYCANHCLENMVNVRHKRCTYLECKKQPNFNYDGDYWLTYYFPEQYCWNKNAEGGKLEKLCKVNLVKHGNTAIVEAPTDLKKYLDKLVNVSGSFVPVLPPIGPGKEYRQFCITKPKRVCSDSKGPGVWYFSPLKLQSIKLAH
jgi:hypothetical protein